MCVIAHFLDSGVWTIIQYNIILSPSYEQSCECKVLSYFFVNAFFLAMESIHYNKLFFPGIKSGTSSLSFT